MRKLFLLFVVSAFFFTLFSLSAYVLAQQFCCCADVCDCSGDTCDVGSPCNWVTEAEECDEGYVPCYDTFCTYCYVDSDCEAIDSDGGKDIYTKGICHEFTCDESEHRCEEKILPERDSGSYFNDYVDEKYPSTDPNRLNECDSERIYCPDGYEYSDRACVEKGTTEGEACDGDREAPSSAWETTCISGLDCCDECSKCYEICPNDLCCDSDDDCSADLPYCNLATNECQAEEAPCPRSEYDTYDKAAGGQIECGGTLSGCLWKTDDKYYKVEGTDGKEVNVTVSHTGDGCPKNDLYIYGSSRYTTIGSSTGRNVIDSWEGEPDNEFIVVRIAGDIYQRNENCKWEMKVKCKDVCDESPSKCSGPYSTLETGAFGVLDGCLYAHDSKFYKLLYSADRKIEVRVTHYGGSECESKNDLLICDGCTNDGQCSEFASIKNQTEATWVGKLDENVEIEIHSDSDNKNCLWSLEADYVSENCVDICTAGDGTPCGKYRCANGDCTTVCDTRCSEDNECGKDKPNNDGCGQDWFCNVDCVCVEGLDEATINIYEGANIVGFPGLTEDGFSECELVNYVSSTRRGCTYGDPENPPHNYFVYYNPLDDGGDCDSNFFSADIMEEGLGYYLYANKECEITFEIPIEVEVTLHPGTNIISVPVETTLGDIASVCGDEDKIFTYYVSAKKRGCIYDDKSYFVYYNPLDDGGDCDSNFFSDEVLRPFIGYYLYFNGKNGDGETSCTFSYENGEFI